MLICKDCILTEYLNPPGHAALSLEDRMPFGIYTKDDELTNEDGTIKSLRQVIESNPNYIQWLLDNVETFHISKEAQDLLESISESTEFCPWKESHLDIFDVLDLD